MARFYFHVQDGRSAPDDEGAEFPDSEAARDEAIRTSGEMLRDCRFNDLDGREWRMTVADDAGRELFTLRVLAESAA